MAQLFNGIAQESVPFSMTPSRLKFEEWVEYESDQKFDLLWFTDDTRPDGGYYSDDLTKSIWASWSAAWEKALEMERNLSRKSSVLVEKQENSNTGFERDMAKD